MQKWNKFAGYDAPMIYGELYIPHVMEGLLIRLGRYISVPDIEAQLAPNNYMYSHSMTYGYDNYTNQGLIGTLQADQELDGAGGHSDRHRLVAVERAQHQLSGPAGGSGVF